MHVPAAAAVSFFFVSLLAAVLLDAGVAQLTQQSSAKADPVPQGVPAKLSQSELVTTYAGSDAALTGTGFSQSAATYFRYTKANETGTFAALLAVGSKDDNKIRTLSLNPLRVLVNGTNTTRYQWTDTGLAATAMSSSALASSACYWDGHGGGSGSIGVDGFIYCTGGWTGSAAVNKAVRINTTLAGLSSLPDMPASLYGHCMVMLNARTLYVAFGKTGSATYSKALYSYDIANGTWATEPSNVTADARFGASCNLHKGKLYAVSGVGQGGTLLNDLWVADLTTAGKTFTRLATSDSRFVQDVWRAGIVSCGAWQALVGMTSGTNGDPISFTIGTGPSAVTLEFSPLSQYLLFDETGGKVSLTSKWEYEGTHVGTFDVAWANDGNCTLYGVGGKGEYYNQVQSQLSTKQHARVFKYQAQSPSLMVKTKKLGTVADDGMANYGAGVLLKTDFGKLKYIIIGGGPFWDYPNEYWGDLYKDDKILIFDVESGTYTDTNLRMPRKSHRHACAHSATEIFCYGGFSIGTRPQYFIVKIGGTEKLPIIGDYFKIGWDPKTGTLDKVTSLSLSTNPGGRYLHSMTWFEDNVYMFGGVTYPEKWASEDHAYSNIELWRVPTTDGAATLLISDSAARSMLSPESKPVQSICWAGNECPRMGRGELLHTLSGSKWFFFAGQYPRYTQYSQLFYIDLSEPDDAEIKITLVAGAWYGISRAQGYAFTCGVKAIFGGIARFDDYVPGQEPSTTRRSRHAAFHLEIDTQTDVLDALTNRTGLLRVGGLSAYGTKRAWWSGAYGSVDCTAVYGPGWEWADPNPVTNMVSEDVFPVNKFPNIHVNDWDDGNGNNDLYHYESGLLNRGSIWLVNATFVQATSTVAKKRVKGKPPPAPPQPKLLMFTNSSLVVEVQMPAASGVNGTYKYSAVTKCDLYSLNTTNSTVSGHGQTIEYPSPDAGVAVAVDNSTATNGTGTIYDRYARVFNVPNRKQSQLLGFFSRCWNIDGVSSVSNTSLFATSGPPLKPSGPDRIAATRTSITFNITSPLVVSYQLPAPGTFSCSVYLTPDGGARGTAATVSYEEFGGPLRSVERTATSYAVGAASVPIAPGKFSAVTACTSDLGKGEDSDSVPIEVFDADPPAAPEIVSVTGRPNSVVVLYKPASPAPANSFDYCAGWVGNTEVFRTNRSAVAGAYKRDGTELACLSFSSGDLCGWPVQGGTVDPVRAVGRGYVQNATRAALKLTLACYNKNGRGLVIERSFTPTAIAAPTGLRLVAAEAQYVSVSFTIGDGGGLPIANCTIYVDGNTAGTVGVDAGATSASMATNPLVRELWPNTDYSIQVTCGHEDGLSNVSAPLTVHTKDSSIRIDFTRVPDLKTNARGELEGSIAAAPPPCSNKRECNFPGNEYQREEFCKVTCKTSSNCKEDYPKYWTVKSCPPQRPFSTVGLPLTLKVSKRHLLAASTPAAVTFSSGIRPANATCADFKDMRANMTGNVATVCTLNGQVNYTSYTLSSGNVALTATGRVLANVPSSMPIGSDLAPVSAAGRRLLQVQSTVLPQNTVYDLTLKNTQTGESTVIRKAVSYPALDAALGTPTALAVTSSSFASFVVSYRLPDNGAFDSAGNRVPISKCSLLSVGTDTAGAELLAEIGYSLNPENETSPHAIVAEGLDAGATYTVIVRCQNAIGSSNRSASIVAQTTVTPLAPNMRGGRFSPTSRGTWAARQHLMQIPPLTAAGAAGVNRTVTIDGYYLVTPTVDVGVFATDGSALSSTVRLPASISPAVSPGTPRPATSLAFTLPTSPWPAAARRNLLQLSGAPLLSLGTTYQLSIREPTSAVVVETAIIWQRVGDFDTTNLTCSAIGVVRRCARYDGSTAAFVSVAPPSAARIASAGTGAAEVVWRGPFVSLPTQVLIGKFDANAFPTCAFAATNIRYSGTNVAFTVPLDPPPLCQLGTLAGQPSLRREMLMTTRSNYDLLMVMTDAERTVVSNYMYYDQNPVSVKAWDVPVSQPATAGDGRGRDLGIGLGVGLGLGLVALVALAAWVGCGARRRAQSRLRRPGDGDGVETVHTIDPEDARGRSAAPAAEFYIGPAAGPPAPPALAPGSEFAQAPPPEYSRKRKSERKRAGAGTAQGASAPPVSEADPGDPARRMTDFFL